ncbi:hypothetical protein [Clostridium minihomine]|uniref:hypothetical protein n=1 Tax=Clostridium minihomine TaxID=2045012 RepID=UPI000C765267|nr:hypothetical protein [Clostridium minihomine]
MKKRYVIFISLFLYLICIGAGVATRNSYTDIWAEAKSQSPENVGYIFFDDKESLIQASVQSIYDEAPIIVLATANTEGDNHGKTFFTEVTVKKVFKNDGSLTGNTLVVCEPIQLEKTTSEKTGLPIYSMQTLHGKSFSRTKIIPGHDYILFLKSFLPKEYRTDPPTFTMIDSPYAKLMPDSTITAENYPKPVWAIDYEKSLQYEILLQDQNLVKTFFDTKKELLSLMES